MLGMDVDGCGISANCWFGGRSVQIGRGSFLNYGVWIEASGPVTIGRDVAIGYQTLICTSGHRIGSSGRRAETPYAKPVIVQDGVWIGARVTLLPGVTVGAGSIVAAGAVVTESLPANGLYGGVPARLIRVLDESREVQGPVAAET